MAKAKDISHLPPEEQEKILRKRRKKAEAKRRRYAENPARFRAEARASMSKAYSLNPEAFRARSKAYLDTQRTTMGDEAFLEGRRAAHKKYRDANKMHVRKKQVEATIRWMRANPERYRSSRNNYLANRATSDLGYRMYTKARQRIHSVLNGKCKPQSATKSIGCTQAELKLYIERLFKPGMSWDNYGEWHLDHRIPLSWFDLEDSKQFSLACSYRNLQPMWMRDNLRKGDRDCCLLGPTLEKLGIGMLR